MFFLNKYYKVNITFNDGENEFSDEIIATRSFNGFFYKELVTNKTFYPLYRYPISIKECMHNGDFMDGNDEINRQLNENGYSMIMFLDDNKHIEEIKDNNEIKEYYNNFPLTTFCEFISKDIQKKKIKKNN